MTIICIQSYGIVHIPTSFHPGHKGQLACKQNSALSAFLVTVFVTLHTLPYHGQMSTSWWLKYVWPFIGLTWFWGVCVFI